MKLRETWANLHNGQRLNLGFYAVGEVVCLWMLWAHITWEDQPSVYGLIGGTVLILGFMALFAWKAWDEVRPIPLPTWPEIDEGDPVESGKG